MKHNEANGLPKWYVAASVYKTNDQQKYKKTLKPFSQINAILKYFLSKVLRNLTV